MAKLVRSVNASKKISTSYEACVAEIPNHLAGLDLLDGFAELDQPVGVDQRRQQPRALARKFCHLEPAVGGLTQIDPDIFAAAEPLFVAEGRPHRHRNDRLL